LLFFKTFFKLICVIIETWSVLEADSIKYVMYW